ncbi:type II toxin-antitoxin system VapB family antitoxin [Thermoanaerobacterium butyriciformans]|uniref:Metal-responsive CopG/Arc/MetJ family transcriptional regulator n=1 Tax=Thermoanaerobacterium butyriciformans TaxID=1702242 RepID=A0ABS4NDJ0_9THEO|nr:type II toxin-antitoxin system VapB family antitoxin [Thermoanaerobacterium butyriciformans]MBP2071254.1 metal-responsive CopG/Arc/MetJ family transcriptional regulator [Thermoanaerobacterium butyriciformans]
MRTTINVSEDILKEAEMLYETNNRSKAVEEALKDAIRMKKLQRLMELKGKINFAIDSSDIEKLRSMEIDER